MIKLKDLWIGDELEITSTGRIGSFEGIHKNGNAIIKSEGKIYLAAENDLVMYVPPKETKKLVFNDETGPSKKNFVGDSIDLHIENLNPNLVGSRPERILDFQVTAFEEYLAAAKRSYKSECTIIHGKGAGVLKSCVMTIIKSDKEIKHYNAVHDGGAVHILF